MNQTEFLDKLSNEELQHLAGHLIADPTVVDVTVSKIGKSDTKYLARIIVSTPGTDNGYLYLTDTSALYYSPYQDRGQTDYSQRLQDYMGKRENGASYQTMLKGEIVSNTQSSHSKHM